MTSLKDYTFRLKSDTKSKPVPLSEIISDAVTVFIQAAQDSQNEEIRNMFKYNNIKHSLSIPITEEEYNERLEKKMKDII